MKTKRFVLFVLAFVVALAACGPGGGSGGGGGRSIGDGPVTLRLASDAPIDHIASRLNNMAADLVYERTEGRVQIQYFPASQLGGYETVYEELMMGTIDIAQITVPDSLDPRLGVGYVPYIATSFQEAEILFAPDSFISQFKAEIVAQHNVRFLGWVLEGFIGMGVVGQPDDVFTPGTSKGSSFRLRTAPLVTFRLVQEDLGYNVVTVPYAEVPVAMQTRVVDGWIGGTPNMNYAWVGELISRMYINYLHAEATAYVMSEVSLGRLPEEDQQIVIEVFQEISRRSFQEAQENEEEFKRKLQEDYGVEIVEFPPEVLAAHVAFVRETTWPRLESSLTTELMDALRAEVAQFP